MAIAFIVNSPISSRILLDCGVLFIEYKLANGEYNVKNSALLGSEVVGLGQNEKFQS